jgi:DNA polymerase III gamma/tau subunit
MITPDLDKLPRSAVSQAQKYHFAKIKDADIANRLKRICAEEGLESEQDALDFISAKSCGSLRDAEMMLDQLSLLGKKITISLVYELVSFCFLHSLYICICICLCIFICICSSTFSLAFCFSADWSNF